MAKALDALSLPFQAAPTRLPGCCPDAGMRINPRRRWSLAIYRHQLASFEFRGETQGLFGRPSFGAPGVRRDLSHRTAYDFDAVSLRPSRSSRLRSREHPASLFPQVATISARAE